MSFTGRKFLLNEELQGETITCINADTKGNLFPLFKMQLNNEEVICAGFGYLISPEESKTFMIIYINKNWINGLMIIQIVLLNLLMNHFIFSYRKEENFRYLIQKLGLL